MNLYSNKSTLGRNDANKVSEDDDEEDNYAEIDVVATNDYYYITNLNHYYERQQQHQHQSSLSPFKHAYHHHRQCAHNNTYDKPVYESTTSSSSSWADFTTTQNKYNLSRSRSSSNIKYQSANRITSPFNNIKYHQHQQHNSRHNHQVQQHQSILEKPSAAMNSFKGISLAGSATPSSAGVLRNTHHRCRRKLFALNFMFKNFIAYRFKYDIL